MAETNPEKRPEETSPQNPPTPEAGAGVPPTPESGPTEPPAPDAEKEEEKRVSLKGKLVEELNKMTPSLVRGIEGDGKILAGDKENFNSSYKKAQELFKELAGEDLNRKIKEEIIQDAKAEGRVLMSEKEYFGKDYASKLEEQEKRRRVLNGIQTGWARLSEKQKEGFHNEPKEFVKKLEDKRKELEKKGFFVPKEAYYELLSSYDMHVIGIRGIFKKKIIIPSAAGDAKTITKKEFQKWIQDYQNYFDSSVSKTVKERLDRGLLNARSGALGRKARKMSELLGRIDSAEPATRTEQVPVVSAQSNRPELKQDKTPETGKEVDWATGKEKILKGAARKNEKLLDIARDIGRIKGLKGVKLENFITAIYTDKTSDLPVLDEKLNPFIDKFALKKKQIQLEMEEALGALRVNRIKSEKEKQKKLMQEIETKLSGI